MADQDFDDDGVLQFTGKKKGKKGKKTTPDSVADSSITSEKSSVSDVSEALQNEAASQKKQQKKKGKKELSLDDYWNDEAPDDVEATPVSQAASGVADQDVDDNDGVLQFTGKKKGKKGKKPTPADSSVASEKSSVSDVSEALQNEAASQKKQQKKKGKKELSLDDYWNDEASGDVEATPGSHGASGMGDQDFDDDSFLQFTGNKKEKKGKKTTLDSVVDNSIVSEKSSVSDVSEALQNEAASQKKQQKKKGKKELSLDDYWNDEAPGDVEATPVSQGASGVADQDVDDDGVLQFTGKKKGKKGKKPTPADSSIANEKSSVSDVSEVLQNEAASQKKQQKKKGKKELSLDDYWNDEAPGDVEASSVSHGAADEEETSKFSGTKKRQGKPTAQNKVNGRDGEVGSVASADEKKIDIADEATLASEAGAGQNVEAEEQSETAASKKKKKKKEKEKEKAKGGAAESEAQDNSKPKAIEKKVPKHVREMQERLAKMKELEEKRKREEEERLRKEEEERLRLEELERQKEEAKQRRKQREKEKLQKKKQEGKLLTGRQKEEVKRLALMREQFLAQNPTGFGESSSTPKKPKYETKKKTRSHEAGENGGDRKEDTGAEATEAAEGAEAAEVADTVEAAPEAEAPEAEEELEEEEEDEDEEEDDDWEAKTWDDDSKLPSVKSSFVEEEEEEPVKPVKLQKPTKSQEIQSPKPSVKPAEPTDNGKDAKDKREARMQEALTKRSAEDLRSPICCILGHVDTGKTKLLDCIRRTNVQEGEAGGITQQIGATYFPMENIRERTKELKADANMRVPGLLVIDTPGHESFTNLRSRGSGLCDIAILVIDIMHGLEPQTIESLNLLKMRKTPFVVALNKVDRLYQWKSRNNAPIRLTMKEQAKDTQMEFETRLNQIVLQLKEQGLNSEVYWKNKDVKKFISIVPTSAISGEGIPDLLLLLVQLTQKMMEQKLMYMSEVQCTVLEVKVVEGLGTTIDVVLVNGVLHEGDQIVVCGMQGPIVTSIRALLTPHPMKELRVKGSYQHHKELKAAQGIKITAQGLEHAIAGTQLYVVGPDDDVEAIKEEAMQDMKSVLNRIDKSGEGVCVQASTLGSLEALLEFLKSPEVSIPVSGISIGPVHKKDVMRASVMLERKKEYATILAFDVKVTPEAREMAEELGVKIFTADIIYHLFDQFTAYLKNIKEEKRRDSADEAIFPCILKILPNCVFNKKDPIIVGVEVLEGLAKVGTPICVPGKEFIDLGRIASLEINHKVVDVAKKGDEVAVKIAGDDNQKMFGRHFDMEDMLVSHITRRSIDVLKENYRTDLTTEEWKLVVKLKKIFEIQ